MSRTQILDDGTVVRYRRSIADVPFFGDWSKLLLTRCAASVVSGTSKDDHGHTRLDETGRPTLSIKAFDRFKEQGSILQADGTVKIVCLGCGTLCSRLDMARISIGGTIQLRAEEQIGPKEIRVSYQRRPVSKMGLGCVACQRRMQDAIERINRTNTERQHMYESMMEIENAKRIIAAHTGSAHSPKEFKRPAILTPYIDVTEEMLTLSEMEITR